MSGPIPRHPDYPGVEGYLRYHMPEDGEVRCWQRAVRLLRLETVNHPPTFFARIGAALRFGWMV